MSAEMSSWGEKLHRLFFNFVLAMNLTDLDPWKSGAACSKKSAICLAVFYAFFVFSLIFIEGRYVTRIFCTAKRKRRVVRVAIFSTFQKTTDIFFVENM